MAVVWDLEPLVEASWALVLWEVEFAEAWVAGLIATLQSALAATEALADTEESMEWDQQGPATNSKRMMSLDSEAATKFEEIDST